MLGQCGLALLLGMGLGLARLSLPCSPPALQDMSRASSCAQASWQQLGLESQPLSGSFFCFFSEEDAPGWHVLPR